jgi:hypothetical protein
MELNNPETIASVTEAFERYERALMEDDIPVMDALFLDAPVTVRYGVGEVLYGSEEIRAFRKGRGGSPQRRLGKCVITTFGSDFAAISVEFFREGSTRRGRQSQSWVRIDDQWKVVSAHVSLEGSGS